MKKASKILFLIGGILAIFLAVTWLALGSVFVAAAASLKAGEPFDFAIELAKDILKDNPTYTMEQVVKYILAVGIVFFVLFVFAIPAAVLSFICKGKEKAGLGLIIPAMALSLFAGSTLSVLGGIFGIIACAQENKAASAPKAE